LNYIKVYKIYSWYSFCSLVIIRRAIYVSKKHTAEGRHLDLYYEKA